MNFKNFYNTVFLPDWFTMGQIDMANQIDNNNTMNIKNNNNQG